MSVASKPPQSPKISGRGHLSESFHAGLGDGIVAASTHNNGNINTALEDDGRYEIGVRVRLTLFKLFLGSVLGILPSIIVSVLSSTRNLYRLGFDLCHALISASNSSQFANGTMTKRPLFILASAHGTHHQVNLD